VTDGAAIVLLARRSYAKKHNLPVLAKFKSYAVAGVAPEIMGIGIYYYKRSCFSNSSCIGKIKSKDLRYLDF
jgi:acetyl-CoA acetyltransferase